MKAFKGPAKQRGFIGAAIGIGSKLLGGLGSGLGGILGGAAQQGMFDQARKDIQAMPGMQGPTPLSGNFGTVGTDGNFQMNQGLLSNQNMMSNTGNQLMGGGLFNDPRFQQAFQGNDIFGAMNQQNAALGQQMGGSAFGGLGGMYNQAAGLSGQFGNELQQGFGSMMGDQLSQMRAAAAPEQNRQFNKLNDRLHAMGMLGSTGGAGLMRGQQEAFGQQDLNFQTEAFGRAQQDFQRKLGAYQGATGMASGLEGQGFGQGLQALQQNQSAGMNRLNQAMGLFGQGSDIFSQQYGLGLQGGAGALDFGRFGLDASSMPQQLQAALMSGSGQHARALSEMATPAAGAAGGFLGGIGSAIGGMFG